MTTFGGRVGRNEERMKRLACMKKIYVEINLEKEKMKHAEINIPLKAG
jgi:hypothetical protein